MDPEPSAKFTAWNLLLFASFTTPVLTTPLLGLRLGHARGAVLGILAGLAIGIINFRGLIAASNRVHHPVAILFLHLFAFVWIFISTMIASMFTH